MSAKIQGVGDNGGGYCLNNAVKGYISARF